MKLQRWIKRKSFHFMLSSCKTDSPQSQDILAVKRSTNTLSPFHNSLLSKNAFASGKSSKKMLKNSRALLDRNNLNYHPKKWNFKKNPFFPYLRCSLSFCLLVFTALERMTQFFSSQAPGRVVTWSFKTAKGLFVRLFVRSVTIFNSIAIFQASPHLFM